MRSLRLHAYLEIALQHDVKKHHVITAHFFFRNRNDYFHRKVVHFFQNVKVSQRYTITSLVFERINLDLLTQLLTD